MSFLILFAGFSCLLLIRKEPAFRLGAFDMYSRVEYVGGMKIKTSITLSRELLGTIDARCGSRRSRSEFIEDALRLYMSQTIRNEENARDLEILNRRADVLNKEAGDVLGYQVIP